MAHQAAYRQFLASPNSSALADDAALHYITTTSSFTGATEIIKHLSSVRNKIKKKKESALFAIENQTALALEADTTLEFVSSGGPYLPGLDDNFLADRTVQIVVSHIVAFNADGKITQIRQSWDQGALLKQVEVIGRSGANWPIRDVKDQVKLIEKCAKGEGSAAAPVTEALPNRSRGSSNAMRDPHATLDLFASRDELESNPAAVISPYAGRRPRQRSFTEILGDEPVEDPSSPSAGRERSQSPSKVVAPKAGAGKNFQPMRLFDTDENEPTRGSNGRDRSQSPSKAIAPKFGAGKNFTPMRLFNTDENEADKDSPEQTQKVNRFIRPDPKKYQHFELDDGSEAPDVPTPKAAAPAPDRSSKHGSNWSFDDFVTPQKPVATRGLHRAHNVRHWGADNDVLENTPAPHPQVIKPRKDADTHFELVDDGPIREDASHANRLPRGAMHNDSLHLYDNRLHHEDGTVPSPGPAPLGNITNLKDRQKHFGAHFSMADESPQHDGASEAPKVGEDRKKAVRMMESNWAPSDESPVSRKENSNPNSERERGIAISGDGMGGRKGTARGWLHGEEDAPEPAKKGIRGPPTKSDNFWDF